MVSYLISPALLLPLLLTCLLSGCAQPDCIMPDGFSPLGPVSITFETFTPDPAVETLLRKKLGYPQGPFLVEDEKEGSEYLHIFYKRQPDLKSIGLIFLSGGLGSVEANFTYILHVQHYSGETLLQEFHYVERIQEYTYSVFADMFNPLYEPQGRSKEIFTLLCHRFLQDLLTNTPDLEFQHEID